MIPKFLFNCFMKFIVSLQLLLYPDQETLTFLKYVEKLGKKKEKLRTRDIKSILKWNPSLLSGPLYYYFLGFCLFSTHPQDDSYGR